MLHLIEYYSDQIKECLAIFDNMGESGGHYADEIIQLQTDKYYVIPPIWGI